MKECIFFDFIEFYLRYFNCDHNLFLSFFYTHSNLIECFLKTAEIRIITYDFISSYNSRKFKKNNYMEMLNISVNPNYIQYIVSCELAINCTQTELLRDTWKELMRLWSWGIFSVRLPS